MGLNDAGVGELHARTPLLEVDNVRMREVFESLRNVATEIKKALNFK